ncbi:type II toxin-antitoxin system RelE/ParE family toxin [Jannaschia sp. W003]|uniref:type II toxin-antitoxin system RelE/ParE family toxin n=1 Tax=Jannaschia sp. W003 TaxID=2867012 RepID=UPI0021A45AAB|nr:type II toxin-antitoxin system RelE/ParE family toxin [Jannaschia sp. W003]UWQ22232.1 type II toxin-antitoxin system RelE/ParE family toxin [Jannaschia sp. W003]
MAWTVEFETVAEEDLRDIFRHLFDSQHRVFENDAQTAYELAAGRVRRIEAAAESLADMPGIGTAHDEIVSNLRHVTRGRAVFWFVADEGTRTIRIVGVFYGAQDHMGRMMRRLGGEGG